MAVNVFPGAHKARKYPNIMLALGLFCLVGVFAIQNLHGLIHQIIDLDPTGLCVQPHSHPPSISTEVAAVSHDNSPAVEPVRWYGCETRLLTESVFLPRAFPPPKSI